MIPNLTPVILAGGSGTRLWPLSRKSKPKQFLALGASVSLIREAVVRVGNLAPRENFLIVAGASQESLLRREFPNWDEPRFLFEPCGRNTAAAIAWAAQVALRRNPKAVLAVLPADQKIPEADHPLFQEILHEAATHAERHGGLITLGLKPRFPATGYGYIQQGERIGGSRHPVHRILSFREKPDAATAERYLKEGGYSWNSGMFVWRAADYLKAYAAFLPRDAALFRELPEDSKGPGAEEAIRRIYPALTSISVDYAILEKSDEIAMVPATFDWDDVGSLQSLTRYFPRDPSGNAVSGKTVALDAKDNLVLSDRGLIACLGVSGLAVIREGDAVLVIPLERSEEVKRLLEEMKKEGKEEYL